MKIITSLKPCNCLRKKKKSNVSAGFAAWLHFFSLLPLSLDIKVTYVAVKLLVLYMLVHTLSKLFYSQGYQPSVTNTNTGKIQIHNVHTHNKVWQGEGYA